MRQEGVVKRWWPLVTTGLVLLLVITWLVWPEPESLPPPEFDWFTCYTIGPEGDIVPMVCPDIA